MYSCSLEVESFSKLFLHCHYFTKLRATFLDELAKFDTLTFFDNEIIEVFLYGSSTYDVNEKIDILNAIINFVWKSKQIKTFCFVKRLSLHSLIPTCIFFCGLLLPLYAIYCMNNYEWLYKFLLLLYSNAFSLLAMQQRFSFCIAWFYNSIFVFILIVNAYFVLLYSWIVE